MEEITNKMELMKSLQEIQKEVCETIYKCQRWVHLIECKYGVELTSHGRTIFGDSMSEYYTMKGGLHYKTMHLCYDNEMEDEPFILVAFESVYGCDSFADRGEFKNAMIPIHLVGANEDELKSYVIDWIREHTKDSIEYVSEKIRDNQRELTHLSKLKNTKINFDDL